MKTLFIDKKTKYDGSQLRPLFAYENYKVLGDSIISWIGPCNITLDHMVDLEDKIENAQICGDEMLHFIIEVFGSDLTAAVSLQRLFASIAKDLIQLETKSKFNLIREGDDIYHIDQGQKKLSISIASRSSVSSQIHFAMNIVNDGTPVSTACLKDLGLEGPITARKLMSLFSDEYESIVTATKKVIPL
ncbi:MAG: DUF366 family protein [Bdellovibrionaceae bacterium]|nr:DUF366 family protein [Pseudobdellovibrionaceae bacterium]